MPVKNVEWWVVYRMTLRKGPAMNAVCEQAEWEAMEMSKPGYHTLIRAGIASESAAEKLARGTSGDLVRRGSAQMAANGFTSLEK